MIIAKPRLDNILFEIHLKSSLFFIAAIESKVIQVETNVPQDAVQIFDGMVILQQMTKIVLPTFGTISEYLINRILKDFSLTYFVTYQYLPGSVKSFEREKRMSAGSIRIRIERRDQKRTKQWSKYLQSPENKTDLIRFLLKDWSDGNRFFTVLSGNKTLYINVGPAFFKLYCHGDMVCVFFSLLEIYKLKLL